MKRKRNLVDELIEGFDTVALHRQGKRTLITHTIKVKPVVKLSASEVAKLRERMNVSRAALTGDWAPPPVRRLK